MKTNGQLRFPNVHAALYDLRKSQDPVIQREVQMAWDILCGRRPGIEEKYDALLLKLDRSWSALEDRRAYWQKIADQSPLARTRQYAKSRVVSLNVAMQDLTWMKARNRDMIEALNASVKKNQLSEP